MATGRRQMRVRSLITHGGKVADLQDDDGVPNGWEEVVVVILGGNLSG